MSPTRSSCLFRVRSRNAKTSAVIGDAIGSRQILLYFLRVFLCSSLAHSIQWMGTILFRILYIFPMWFCSAASWAFPLISPQSCYPTSEKFAESVSGFDHIRWRFLRLFFLALTDSPIVWTLLIGFLSLSSMGSLATFPLCHKCRLQIRRSFLLLWSNFFDVSYNISIFLVASLYSASVAGTRPGKMCWFSFSKVCS